MKTKTIIKIVVDILMIGLFVPLLFAYGTGLVFHEILGITILALFLLHLVLNSKWIVMVSKKILNGKINKKTLLMYILNILLLLGIVIIIVTGIMVSSVLFPASNVNSIVVDVHKISSYITGVLLALHLLLHIKYFAKSIKNIAKSIFSPKVIKVLGSSMAILIVAGIIYYNLISGINNKMEMDFNASPKTNESNISNIEEKITSSESEEKKENDVVSSAPAQEEKIGLTEFLSKMFCTACPRRCPLSSPQCSKSASQIQKATEEYQSLHGSNNNLNH